MALFISGELRPPTGLKKQIQADLAAIRSTHGKDIPKLSSIHFWSLWSTTNILLGLHNDSLAALNNGTYHEWDKLNQEYGVTSIEQVTLGLFTIRFDTNYHPRPLTQIYIRVPGVSYAGPNLIYGDRPQINPVRVGNELTYLFRDAWGDCPAGCTEFEYWYFTFDIQHQPVLAGHWNPQSNSDRPAWWNKLQQDMGNYSELWRVPELFKK